MMYGLPSLWSSTHTHIQKKRKKEKKKENIVTEFCVLVRTGRGLTDVSEGQM